MKKFDKYLIRVLLSIIAILVVYMLFVNVQGLLFIIGVIMGFGAFFFMLGHLGLGYPSFVICFILVDFYEFTFNKINNFSKILAVTSRFLFVIISYFCIVVGYLYIMYMCLEYNTSMGGFTIFMNKIGEL